MTDDQTFLPALSKVATQKKTRQRCVCVCVLMYTHAEVGRPLTLHAGAELHAGFSPPQATIHKDREGGAKDRSQPRGLLLLLLFSPGGL